MRGAGAADRSLHVGRLWPHDAVDALADTNDWAATDQMPQLARRVKDALHAAHGRER
jgi:hypothetical protein